MWAEFTLVGFLAAAVERDATEGNVPFQFLVLFVACCQLSELTDMPAICSVAEMCGDSFAEVAEQLAAQVRASGWKEGNDGTYCFAVNKNGTRLGDDFSCWEYPDAEKAFMAKATK